MYQSNLYTLQDLNASCTYMFNTYVYVCEVSSSYVILHKREENIILIIVVVCNPSFFLYFIQKNLFSEDFRRAAKSKQCHICLCPLNSYFFIFYSIIIEITIQIISHEICRKYSIDLCQKTEVIFKIKITQYALMFSKKSLFYIR